MPKTVKAYAAFLPEIRQLLQAKELSTLKTVLREINPVDLAEGWKELTAEEQLTLFRLLAIRRAVVVFEELDVENQTFLLQSLGEQGTGQMVNELENSIDQSCRSVNHALHCKGTNRHLCNLMFDQTELGDRLTELNSLFCISHCILQCAFCPSQSTCTQFETTDVEGVKSDHMPSADLS